jgi:hypothetical protein
MKKCLLPVVLMLLSSMAIAQLPSYDVASIPDSVKKDANVIKRYDNTVFEVMSIDRASIKSHEVYTLMNDKYQGALHYVEYTSKFRTLEDVEIKVYDAKGKQVNKYHKKDLYMRASGDGLIDDRNFYLFSIPVASYPVTVEYISEVRVKGTLFYPDYTPGHKVLQSTFTAKVPKDLDLRYFERNIALAPKVTEDDKYKTYQWTGSNLPEVTSEEGTSESVQSRIILAPSRFKMDEYDGDMSSWKSLGAWYAALHKGLDVLPENRKAFLNDLVKNAKDDREKVRLVYDYLQQNFRYISIQLGIGGWRSLPADFTDQKKYGDCKGLTNYMYAALKAVGVKSYPALINAEYNKEPLDPRFPMNGFNHVILCVPQPKDSIWLECTSKTAEFGILGSFTENRNALLITDEGGVLVATPSSKCANNKFNIYSTITIQNDGSGKTMSTFTTTGSFKEGMMGLLESKKDDQKEAIVNNLGFKQPDEFTLNKKTATAPSFVTELDMTLEKIPEFVAGNKMFFSPRLYRFNEFRLPKAEKRKYDYYFHNSFQSADTTLLQLPEGFVVDALPQPKQAQCKYASYTTKYWYDETKKAVYSSTSLTLNQLKIPAAEYADVKKFFDEVVEDDAQRIVIKKP